MMAKPEIGSTITAAAGGGLDKPVIYDRVRLPAASYSSTTATPSP